MARSSASSGSDGIFALIFFNVFSMPLKELRVVGMKMGTGMGTGTGTGTGYGLWYICMGMGINIGTVMGNNEGVLGISVCVPL
jgi:hypothetical protein